MRSLLLTIGILFAAGAVLHPLMTGATGVATAPVIAKSPIKTVAAVPPAPATITALRGAEGFWRVGRTAGGVWWFINPAGAPDWLNTVTTVVPFQRGRNAEGPDYVSLDYSESAGDPAVADWAKRTIDRLHAIGFKGLGAWCHPIFHQFDVPITRDLNISTYMAGESKRVFSPTWADTVDRAVREQVTQLSENKNLVGYFIDNELDWSQDAMGPRVYFDHLPAGDPNRAAVVRSIQQLWPDVESLNRDWKTAIANYDELAALPQLPEIPGDSAGRLYSAWLETLAREYFVTTTRVIREHDPNHLILGVRFKGFAPPEVVRASRGLTDAQSINYYVSDGRLDSEMFQQMHDDSGQPVLVTEYSFHALDGRSGNRNTVGFAAQVLDQQARADGYRLFTSRLARVPYIIGADWFQWSDEPPSGRRADGEDVNFGVVDVDDRPYEKLADAIREIAPTLNPQHAASSDSLGSDIWRDSFAAKPSITVPYLSTPPRLNGELSDWPAAAKVQGMKVGQAIGSERAQLPVPNFYMGWTREGLYVGMEVFDNDIQSAPANGWWWTRDCVEFWVNTQPVGNEQIRYDEHCHQFFFVPINYPGSDGVAGVVGQWHRPGDALSENLIPHPQIKDAVRVLPDRYVAEIFIPAAALNGFDPSKTRMISVNYHVRNFQHAIEYFWSAPKEAMTQLRPNTWGIAYLEEPNGSLASTR